eukprot:TRINITY_DN13371_c0_g2_i2.p1 TRINITY_DN13371_c0_g2~~TRINITY_DN13371_c0_g2_i2.p1  ORF type:complete len:436 (+),score=75.83 TRINITY_DN13371_c0_g2_i2:79-1386(+)
MQTSWRKIICLPLCIIFTVLVIESQIGKIPMISQTLSFEYHLQERSRIIQAICEQNRPKLMWPQKSFRRNLKNHVWDFSHRLSYCPIAKVASTTWFLNFLDILNLNMQGLDSRNMRKIVTGDIPFAKIGKKGKINGIEYRNIVRNLTAPMSLTSEELTRAIKAVTPFMIVRHPFTRLVSAYEDKMLNPKPLLEYHKTVQNEIKRRRGKSEDQNFVFPKHLLMTEMYQLMLKRKTTTLEELRSQPSFPEFVSWLLESRSNKSISTNSWKKDMMAFKPFFSVCPVCQVDYAVIKLDGEGNEIESWIDYLGLNLTSTEAHTKGGTPDKALDYFSQLTKDQVADLFNIYNMDFRLFSYTPDLFLRVAKGNIPVEKMASLSPEPLRTHISNLFMNRIKIDELQKLSSEEKKGLDVIEKAKIKQISKIESLNKQFSASIMS